MSPGLWRRLAATVASSVLALGMASCSRATPVEGEGRLNPDGRVILTEQGGEPATVARTRSVQTGDMIEVVEGTAKVTLPAGDVLELQPRSVLFFNTGPELRRGDLLVTANGSSSRVRAAGSRVTVSGAARITLSPALRVVTYQGTATLGSGGRELEVPALRSADVPLVGLLPGRPSPLVIDRADPWVGRFLRQAADKQAELDNLAQGFTARVPGTSVTAGYLRDLLPELATHADFQKEEVDRLGKAQAGGPVRAGEVLAGSAVALLGSRGTFHERLIAAAEFRAEGANLALVAVDQQVPSLDALIATVNRGINNSNLELAVAPPPVATPPSTRPPSAPVTTTTRAPATGPTPTSPTTRPPGRTTPTQPTSTVPPPLQLGPLLNATIDPVLALLNDLLNRR